MPTEIMDAPRVDASRLYWADVFLTGAWLGATQVALAFAIVLGGGASALLFFALVAAWIAGAAIGVTAIPVRLRAWVLFAALEWAVLARSLLWIFPFSRPAMATGFLAAALVGAYAGLFLRDRSRECGKVRRVLFHENNGFVVGYVAASIMLMVSTLAVDATAAFLGVVVAANVAFAPGSKTTTQAAPK